MNTQGKGKNLVCMCVCVCDGVPYARTHTVRGRAEGVRND
jgi:hypothetical protein